ncbi:MAG: tetratricopeptide repeat protein [Verrucomicrobia bacterium]|nr:tetratricopeptide repeat protein [Verrucomicrobiota bacterium]
MTLNTISQARKISNLAQSPTDSNALLERVEKLVKSYEGGLTNPIDATPKAYSLIEELFNLIEKDLPLAREGLCRLLKVNIEEVQIKLIPCLKRLFHLSLLAYDVENNQSQQLVGLEKQISDILASHVRSSSSELLLALVDLYQDILERFWLLPHLIEDRNSYGIIVRENGQRMIREADRWLPVLLNDNTQPEEFKLALKSLPGMFQRIISSPPAIIKEIEQLKPELDSIMISVEIGDICHKAEDYQRAIVHYLENIRLVASIRDQDPKLKRDLGNLTYVILNRLGIVYHSLGEYRKAIEHHEKSLQIAQELGDRAGEGRAYGNLGDVYHSLGEYRKAIEHHEKSLQIAQELGNRAGEGRAYGNLGNVYQSQGEYYKALEYLEKYLQIALELRDRAGEGRAYGNLGNAYYSLGEYRKAIEYHKKHLQIAQALGDQAGEGSAYGDLGVVYQSLGEYRKALEYLEKHLQIAQELGDRAEEGRAYGNLGTAYDFLGEYRKAIECHEKTLQIAQALGDQVGKGSAYGNLGNVYQSLGEYRKAIEYHEKCLQITQELGDRSREGKAYGNLGSAYYFLGEYHKGIEYDEKYLQIAQALGDRSREGRAYGNLGVAYRSLGEYHKAIEYLEKALQIAQKLGDRGEEGKAFNNLGLTYQHLNDLPQAEKHFYQSVAIYSFLQDILGDNHQWKITIFEEQSRAYFSLERVLLKQGKAEEALEITDSRRSRALVSMLSSRVHTPTKEPIYLTYKEIQSLAQKLNTTFVTYSLSSLSEDESRIHVWVVPPSGGIECIPISCDKLPDQIKEDIEEASKVLQTYPFISAPPRVRPPRAQSVKRSSEEEIPLPSVPPSIQGMQEITRGDSNAAPNEDQLRSFKERLSQCYEAFILPIEKYLPRDPEQTLTIIPDSFLSQIPFAAFRDKEGKYLIEKCAISFAPSIKAVQLLDQLPRNSSSNLLIVANPTSPNVSDNNLQGTEKEAEIVKKILGAPTEKVLLQERPTVHRVLEELPQARWIHLACHGLPGDKPEEKLNIHSVFEGVLKLAKDPEDLDRPNGFLYAQDIASLSLQAELVFMSACFSGRGKLQREGSIGHNWSFLAAGARSTVSTYWRIPVNDLTESIIDTFYRHLLGKEREKLSGAQALRQAMLSVIEKDRENLPQVWAAFFLSGLSEVEVRNKG